MIRLTAREAPPEGAECSICLLAGRPLTWADGLMGKGGLAIVGEGPGEEEATRGRPFVGRSGQLLTKVMSEAGLRRDACLVTNAVACHPEGNATPTAQMIRACSGRLRLELERRRPELIVTVGESAARALGILPGARSLGSTRGILTKLGPEWGDLAGTPVLPTWHPAAVLRNPSFYADLAGDLRLAARIVRGEAELLRLSEDGLPSGFTWRVLHEPEELAGLLRQEPWRSWSRQRGPVSLDVEVDSKGRLLCFGFLPVTGSETPPVPVVALPLARSPELVGIFQPWLDRQALLGHNLQYDVKVLWSHGLRADVAEDTLLMRYTTDERTKGATHDPGSAKDLKTLAQRLLGAPKWNDTTERYISHLEDAPKEEVWKYNALDVWWTSRLWLYLQQDRSFGEDERQVYRELLIPGSNVLARMEYLGVRVDRQKLLDYGEVLGKEQDEAGAEFRRLSLPWGAVNPASPQQLGHLFYLDLGLPKQKLSSNAKKKTPYPVDRDTVLLWLEFLSETPDFPERETATRLLQSLLRWRKADKLRGTYTKKLVRLLDEESRLHGRFKLFGTVTGRLSSADPNLQNIPARDEGGKALRDAFVATPGYVWLKSDLSQAELRVLAALSGDVHLREALVTGDVHRAVAARIAGKHPEDVTKAERQQAKSVNFGIVYGEDAPKLAEQTGLSLPEAEELMRTWFAQFPQAREWIEETKRTILRDRYVRTVYGRKRRFPYIPPSGKERKEILRQGVNAVIQSAASDIVLSALIRLDRMIDWKRTRLLVTVHDEIDLETQEDPVEVGRMVAREMTRTPFDDVMPFEAEVGVGPSWGSLVDLDLRTGRREAG